MSILRIGLSGLSGSPTTAWHWDSLAKMEALGFEGTRRHVGALEALNRHGRFDERQRQPQQALFTGIKPVQRTGVQRVKDVPDPRKERAIKLLQRGIVRLAVTLGAFRLGR